MVRTQYKDKKDRTVTIETGQQPWMGLQQRRSNAIKSLVDSLSHLPIEQQIATVTGWYSLEKLEEIARFQKRD